MNRADHRPRRVYDGAVYRMTICQACLAIWPCWQSDEATDETRFWITDKGREAVRRE